MVFGALAGGQDNSTIADAAGVGSAGVDSTVTAVHPYADSAGVDSAVTAVHPPADSAGPDSVSTAIHPGIDSTNITATIVPTGPAATAAANADDADEPFERRFDGLGERYAGRGADTAGALPPFQGNYRILVARPAYAFFDDGDTARWISAMAEVYAHYKVAAFARAHVFSMEEIDAVLPGSRDYGRRIGRMPAIEAARKLGATHILFQSYRFSGGREAGYAMELYRVREAVPVAVDSGVVSFSDFERGLDTLLAKIAGEIDTGAVQASVFGLSVIGGDSAVTESLGGILAGEGEFTKERAAAMYAAVNKHVAANPSLAVARYAAAFLAGSAGDLMRAIDHTGALFGGPGDFPALRLRYAGYLRMAGHYNEAVQTLETIADIPALSTPMAMEMAAIHAAAGDTARARAEYGKAVQSGEANAETYFRAALLAALAGDAAASAEYMKRADSSGFKLNDNEYYELGTALSRVPGQVETAVKYIKRSLGPAQNDEKGWLTIADAYRYAQKRELEADIYVNLFKRNMAAYSNTNVYSERLKLAGNIYDSLGMADRAKEAYSLFLDSHLSDPEVSVSLARIFVKQGECKKLPSVLSMYASDPEVSQMFRDCGFARLESFNADAVIKRGEKSKTSKLTLGMRISGPVIAAAGIAGGLYYDAKFRDEVLKHTNLVYHRSLEMTPAEHAEYMARVKEMEKTIDGLKLRKNSLYIMGGAGAVMFAASYYF